MFYLAHQLTGPHGERNVQGRGGKGTFLKDVVTGTPWELRETTGLRDTHKLQDLINTLTSSQQDISSHSADKKTEKQIEGDRWAERPEIRAQLGKTRRRMTPYSLGRGDLEDTQGQCSVGDNHDNPTHVQCM